MKKKLIQAALIVMVMFLVGCEPHSPATCSGDCDWLDCKVYKKQELRGNVKEILDRLTQSKLNEPTFPNQVQNVLNACGIITDGYAYGSCVAIGPNLLLTAGHCIGDNRWIDLQSIQYEIVEQWISDDYDVGFVRINGRIPYIELGLSLNLLDEIYLVGTPRDKMFLNSITRGIVCKLDLQYSNDVVDWRGTFLCDATAWHGNSGGPVLNERGQIVGIYVGLFSCVDNFSICVPVTDIKAALQFMPWRIE